MELPASWLFFLFWVRPRRGTAARQLQPLSHCAFYHHSTAIKHKVYLGRCMAFWDPPHTHSGQGFSSTTAPMSPRTIKHHTRMTPAAATTASFPLPPPPLPAAAPANEKATDPPGSRLPRSSLEGGASRLPGMQLRDYQARIAAECERANTIAILPTGSGKTLIAAEVIKRLGPPALFLVPTCLLVKQQAIALRAWTGLRVAEYKGGMALPRSFDVLVSTPESFKMAQRSGPSSSLLHWDLFRVIVFDEVSPPPLIT